MDTPCSDLKNVSCLALTYTKDILLEHRWGSKRQAIFIVWVYNLNSFVQQVLDFK